jgi:hypothetical protein
MNCFLHFLVIESYCYYCSSGSSWLEDPDSKLEAIAAVVLSANIESLASRAEVEELPIAFA